MNFLRLALAFLFAASAAAQTAVTIQNQTRRLQTTVPYIVFPPTSIRMDDTDASHQLVFTNGSNLTANRTLTIKPGDANLELDFTGALPGYALVYDGSKWVPTAGGGGGGVSSVALSVPAFLSVAGSPITSSGTLAVSLSGTALPLANGGTGGTSASAARTALGLAIGTDVTGVFTVAGTFFVRSNGNDGTAAVGRLDLPYLTLSAAYTAASAGQTINIGVGTFAPLGTTAIKAGVSFIGSGRPNFNSGSTGLTGGTIIQGPLAYKADGLQFRNLGVDSGSAVCTSLYGGTAQEGLYCTVAILSGEPQFNRLVVDNVISICKDASSAVHAFAVEGYSYASVTNVETKFGTHGQAYKIQNSTVSGLRTQSNASNGIIIKSDYNGGVGRTTKDSTFSDIYVNGGSVGQYGVCLQCNDNSAGNYQELKNVAISNVVATGVQTSFLILSNATTARDLISDISVTNVIADSPSVYGIQVFGYTKRIAIVNSKSIAAGTDGFLTHASAQYTRISSSSATNSVAGYGFRMAGVSEEVNDSTTTDNALGGYFAVAGATVYESNNGGNEGTLFSGDATWLSHTVIGIGQFAQGLDSNGAIRSTGATTPASGSGVEIQYGSVANSGSILAYNRTGAAYRDLLVDGLDLKLNSASGGFITAGGVFRGGASGLSIASGGTNQSILLSPNGTGYVGADKGLSISGASNPSAGSSVEIQYGSVANSGSILAYNRAGSAYRDLLIDGLTLKLNTGSAGAITAGSGPTTLTDSTGKILSAALNTVAVANGGTGVASLTAYAPLFGGTTSTGAVQSGTAGTAGQVLTSNGAGVLPTFQAAGGALTSTQIGYGNGSNVLTGEAAFAYNATTNIATIGGISLGAGSEVSSIGPLVDTVDGTTPLNNIIQTIAAGTAYTMTASYASLDFGTTDPVVTIANAGTYAIYVDVQFNLVGATYATYDSVSIKLRRTNNTAADLAGSTFGTFIPTISTITAIGPYLHVGPIKYTSAGTTDTITVQAVLNSTPTVGSVTATACTITAIRMY